MENLEILFESKRQNVWWKKMYKARDIMNIFWYHKWERFLWAIQRAIKDINDKNIISKNFIKIIDRNTWGRNRQDYYLTLEGVYLVLQKCDNRKEEVKHMIKYIKKLKQIWKELKITKNKKNNFLYSVFLILFLIFFLVFYFLLQQILLKYQNIIDLKKDDNVFIDDLKKELIISSIKQEEKKKENKLESKQNIEMSISLQEKYDLFKKNINSYKDIFIWWNFNLRNEFTISLLWEDLIKYMFIFWNDWFFKESCSLFSKNICLRSSKDLSSYSNFFLKTISWIKNIEVKKSNWWKNRYCVTYEYNLKNDVNPNVIKETFLYILWEKNWVFQIEKRFCQKITKWNKNIPCPYKLKSYECIK